MGTANAVTDPNWVSTNVIASHYQYFGTDYNAVNVTLSWSGPAPYYNQKSGSITLVASPDVPGQSPSVTATVNEFVRCLDSGGGNIPIRLTDPFGPKSYTVDIGAACPNGLDDIEITENNNRTILTLYYGAGHPLAPAPVVPIAPIVTAGNCYVTDAQLAGIARAAGFPENKIVTAVAIAFAESNGKVNAINKNLAPVSFDIGLWQINDVAHPSYDRVMLGTNPIFNGSAAFAIYTAANSSFSPWSSFNNNSYSVNLTRANNAFNDSAGASLAITNCSGTIAAPKDTNGDGIPDAPIENPDCHFTFNPFTALKCAFVPSSGSFQKWTEFSTTAQQKPPLSILSSAYVFVTGFSDQYVYCQGNVTVCGAQPKFSAALPGSTREYDFDPLSKAAIAANDVNSNYQIVKTFIRIFLWAMFAFYVYRRITVSFGAKSVFDGEAGM